MQKTKEFIINRAIHGVKAGNVVRLKVDSNGIPIDKLWRRRWLDAKTDNCMTAQPKPSKPAESKDKPKKED